MVKLKAFFIIFKWLSVAKDCLRPEIAPLRLFPFVFLIISIMNAVVHDFHQSANKTERYSLSIE